VRTAISEEISSSAREPPRWGDALLRALAAGLSLTMVCATVGGGLRAFTSQALSGYLVLFGLCILTYGGVGSLLTQHRPRQIAGWLLLSGALLLAYLEFLPALLQNTAFASWLPANDHQAGQVIAVGFLILVVLIGPLWLPDGRLPSPRWRLVPALIAICIGALVLAIKSGIINDLDSMAAATADQGLVHLVVLVGTAVLALLLIGCIGLLAFMPALAGIDRYRTSTGAVRQQVKWLAFAFLLIPVSLAVSAVTPEKLASVAFFPFFVSVALLPVAIAIAVLRYGLYSIDTLISRTFVYGSVTAVLAGGFALLSNVLDQIAKESAYPSAGVVATSVILTTAFRPLRDRMQRIADTHLRPAERPAEYMTRVRQWLSLIVQTHATGELAARVLDDAVGAFDARAGRIAVTVLDGGVIERRVGAELTAPEIRIPLEAGERRVGLLELGPRRGGRAYREKELQLLVDLCGLAARALIASEGAQLPAQSKAGDNPIVA